MVKTLIIKLRKVSLRKLNFDQALVKKICDKFLQFYNEFINKSLEDRKYVIKTSKKI